jgi:FHS family L-fucose permease-like MFS transporter
MKTPVVPREYLLAFVLLTICFAAWGVANNMTDPLVKVFSRVFTMTNLQGALVQFSFYGAYFCLALPAAILIKKTTYKTGVLTGLGLFILGALLFFPASMTMVYWHFLAALFVLAGGLSILETSANPYIIALGPEETSTQRLNLAQAFNPVGSNLGVFLAGVFILSKIHPATEEERLALASENPEALLAIQKEELFAVMTPYVGVAVCLLILWVAIALVRMPRASEADNRVDLPATLGRLLRNPHYGFGVVAQFFYVAAQICVWTFTIQYGTSLLGLNEQEAGQYLQASIFLFLIFRFVCTALMRVIRPSRMLWYMASAGVCLSLVAVFFPGLAGMVAVVLLSAAMSLMFPTIYGIALKGLGDDTKIGAAGLVMAILGGALLPLLQAAIMDAFGAAISFTVPCFCFVVVAAFAWFDGRNQRENHGLGQS